LVKKKIFEFSKAIKSTFSQRKNRVNLQKKERYINLLMGQP